MKVVFTPQAASDIAAIFDYIQKRHPSGALKTKKAIYASIGLLELLPYMGSRTNLADVRMLPVSRYPYLIFYTVKKQQQEISLLSIRHAARQR